MVLAGACSLLMAWNISYMFGIVLTVIFVSCGNASSAKAYLADQSFRKEERRLIRSRFYGMGAVLEQAVMLIFINAFSGYYLKNGSAALLSYSLQIGNEGYKKVYHAVLLACLLLNLVLAVGINIHLRRRDK